MVYLLDSKLVMRMQENRQFDLLKTGAEGMNVKNETEHE